MSTTSKRLAEARERHKRAQDRADYLYRHTGVPDDPGAVSGIRRRSTPRQVAQSSALTDRALDAAQDALSICITAWEDGDRGVIRRAANQAIAASIIAEGAHQTLTALADHFDQEEEP